jgi:NTP pyrophosphatase (non-canonical NTP hydrolase)
MGKDRMINYRPYVKTLDAISREVIAARDKFPGTRHLLAALVEEVGELAKAYLQKQGDERVYNEAKQVACLAIRIMEEGDSAFNDVTDAEAKA